MQEDATQEMSGGVVAVAGRMILAEAIEDGLQGVEGKIQAAVSVVVASDGHHRRAIVGVLLERLLRELLRGVRLIMGELHGRRDFALLDYLQPDFHLGMKKQLKTRLFNFYAVNRQA